MNEKVEFALCNFRVDRCFGIGINLTTNLCYIDYKFCFSIDFLCFYFWVYFWRRK